MLLVALCLIGGSGIAWADATSLYERGTTNAWAASDVASGQWSAGTIGASGLEVTDGVASTKTISPASGTSILTWTATWNPGNATGAANNTNAYISFGDVKFAFYGSSWFTKVTIGSETTTLSGGGGTRERDYVITVSINQTTNQVSYSFNDNGNIIEGTGVTASAGYFTTLTHGLGGKAPTTWTNTAILKKVEVTEEPYTASTANVTFKYEDTNGNSLSGVKADVVQTQEVGATIADIISSTLTATFYNGTSNKYVYANSYTVTGDYTTVQSTGNTVTLKFTDYPATAYNVEAQVGGNDLTSLASGTAYFDGSTTEYWHKFIKYNDQWYETNSTPYYAAITTETTNVAYTANNDIDYYYDENDMTRAGNLHASYTKDFMSQGDGVRLAANATLYTEALTAGIYKVTIAASSYSGTPFIEFGYRLSDTNNKLGQTGTWSNTTTAATQEFTVAIPEDASFCIFTGDGYSNLILDYVTLKKLPDNVSKNITSAGWATYCSPYALDFSEVEGLTAYIVTGGADGKLTKSVVTSVPAGTGVLLKGAAGDYTIPVAASSATNVTGNKLTGVTTATQIAAEAGYVLMNGSEGVAFYKNAHAFNVGANTAYLPANFATNAARAFFSFGDDATGIRLIENGELKKENSVYDLQGRRIDGSRMNSGIYIHNGRKVFVK